MPFNNPHVGLATAYPELHEIESGRGQVFLGDIDGIAFGMLNDNTPTFPIRTLSADKLLRWHDLLPCAVFDEWIANRDRMPNNLVFDKNDVFWIFDHDDALQGHVTPSYPIAPQLLTLAGRDKSEHELFRIKNNALKIVETYRQIDWNQIKKYLEIDQISGSKVYFERFIQFLIDRLSHMDQILVQDLGIKQQELFSSTKTKTSKDSKQ